MKEIKKRFEKKKEKKEAALKQRKEGLEKKQTGKLKINFLIVIVWIVIGFLYIWHTDNYTFLAFGIYGVVAAVPAWNIAFIVSAKNEENNYIDYLTLTSYTSDIEDIVEDAIENETNYRHEIKNLKNEIERITNDSELAAANKKLQAANERLIKERDKAIEESENYKTKIIKIYSIENLGISSDSVPPAVATYVNALIDKGWLFMFNPHFYVNDEDYRNVINNNAATWRLKIAENHKIKYLMDLQTEAGLVAYKKPLLKSSSNNGIIEKERTRRQIIPKKNNNDEPELF